MPSTRVSLFLLSLTFSLSLSIFVFIAGLSDKSGHLEVALNCLRQSFTAHCDTSISVKWPCWQWGATVQWHFSISESSWSEARAVYRHPEHTAGSKCPLCPAGFVLLRSGLHAGPLTPENTSQLLIYHPWQSGLSGKGQKTGLVMCHFDSVNVFRQHIFLSVRFVTLSKDFYSDLPMSLMVVCDIQPKDMGNVDGTLSAVANYIHTSTSLSH